MRNAFTIDLEDWYQAVLTIPFEEWSRYEDRVERGTERLLDLLDRYRVRATFFVLGYVAERHPDLIQEIQRRGHEIGSHGYSHKILYWQSPSQFADELKRSLGLLKRLTGQRIQGYRAPWFSITHRSLWALEILAEEGITYDSSIVPTRSTFYGIPSAPRTPYILRTRRGLILWEFPPATASFLKFNCPVGGGFYLRFLPISRTCRILRRINQEGHSFVVYVHPWELDKDQPHLQLPLTQFLVHYWNLGETEKKLKVLLENFDFAPIGEVLQATRKEQNLAIYV